MDGINFLSGLRDQNFGEKGAQGSKKRQENRDQWVPDIPCYDPGISPAGARFSKVPLTFRARNQIFKSKYRE